MPAWWEENISSEKNFSNLYFNKNFSTENYKKSMLGTNFFSFFQEITVVVYIITVSSSNFRDYSIEKVQ